MRLVTAEYVSTYAGCMEIPAGMRVVVPDWAAMTLLAVARKKGLPEPRVSGLGDYTRHYCGQDLAGKELLAWRGCGLGDQMVFAGVLRILKQRFPTARIDYYCHPQVSELWEGVAGLPFDVWPEPIAFEDWCANDYHLVGEELCEADREPDQPNVWTAHLAYAGLSGVPAHERRPLVPCTDRDEAAAAEWLNRRDIHSPVVVWQLSASTPIRSVAPDTTERCLRALAAAFPAAAIVVLGTYRDEPVYRIPGATNLWPVYNLPIRVAFALVKRAAALVCPDSCLGHVAGAFDTPCVSLWASFHPQDRVATYPSHDPIYVQLPCGPCRRHEEKREARGCPLAEPEAGKWCRGLAQVDPDAVVAAVRRAFSRGE